jgi:hypothetical protein
MDSNFMDNTQDRNYTRIYGISSSVAFSAVMKVLFPESELANLASHEFKEASKLVEVITKNVNPINDVVTTLVVGMEKEQEAVLKGAQSALAMCATSGSFA